MGVIQFILHLVHLVLPAWFMAGVLSLAVVGWRGVAWSGPRARRWGRVVLWLAGSGSAVLVMGLLVHGRDGRMSTYAALVLVMGTVAALCRRHR